MELRLAVKNDLQNLKGIYEKIIDNMNKNNIEIWDEIYPCEFFQNDIENNSLYILTEGDDIVAAFALSESVDGIYEEKIDDFVLREYGFEIEVFD